MYQSLTIVGNVGKDAEMRYIPNGSAVTTFNVATNRTWKDANGAEQKETVWFRVTTWGKQAETHNQYVKSGMKVLCEGRLTPVTAYMDKNGKPAASLEMTANTVRYLSANSGNHEGNHEGAPEGHQQQSNGNGMPLEDDIPF